MSTTVETSYGKVSGFDDDGILTFLGIPYAAPPVGDLRFKPPRPPRPWTGTREATAWGLTPPQPALPITTGLPPQGEDCLHVSVWTPATQGADRPVMVWIHGGAFMVMAASDPGWNGRNLAAATGAVIVSVEYRTGALGFMHLADAFGPEFDGSGCAGILDQIAALDWVRTNAEVFGGDPTHVTVFGESAGAMSVGTLLAMPSARGLFHRAILQSGAAHTVVDREAAAAGTELFLDVAGVDGPTELSSLPPETIIDLQNRTTLDIIRNRRGAQRALGIAWCPVVDGQVLPERPVDAVAAGAAGEIPIVVGTTKDEFRLFSTLMSAPVPRDIEKFESRVRYVFDGDGDAEAIAHGYVDDAGGDVHAGAVDFLTDLVFRIPAERLAAAQAPHRDDTRMYRFDYPSPLLDGRLGACHAIELPFLFDPSQDSVMALLAGPERPIELTRAVQGVWSDFAHGGTGSVGPLEDWETWTPTGRATAVFDTACRVVTSPDADRIARWDGLW
ncbi:MAG: carboxylesterase/lipase family protein [Acidimicrobiia bacterium]|nr:carboxylesterase/lipase family protein [Acidimicrobiia bacterium]